MNRDVRGGANAPPQWRDWYQPHWVWAAGSLVIPAALLTVSMLGMARASFVSTAVAALVPNVALGLALALAGAALVRGHRVPIVITLAGLMLTLAGFWWLRWVS
jgi:hypothetical protein